MNEMLKVESMEFTADIAGALDETRVVMDVFNEAIRIINEIIEIMR